MEEPKFKVGDCITNVVPNRGLEDAVVTRIENGKYYLKIMCGAAIIPISSQSRYKLKK